MLKFSLDPTINIGHLMLLVTIVAGGYAWAVDTRNIVLAEQKARLSAQKITNEKIDNVTSAVQNLDWKIFNLLTNNPAKPRADLGTQK